MWGKLLLKLEAVHFILGHHTSQPSEPTKMSHKCQAITNVTMHCSIAPADLATGYMSGKLLLKLEAGHFMLGHHTSPSTILQLLLLLHCLTKVSFSSSNNMTSACASRPDFVDVTGPGHWLHVGQAAAEAGSRALHAQPPHESLKL
jgi:hypothetical protein